MRNGLPNVEAAVGEGAGFVRAYRHALDGRKPLHPPAKDQARIARHYVAYEKALDDLDALNARTAPDASTAGYATALRPVSEEFYALNRFEKRYGFKKCGSEPGPNGERGATG